MGSNISSLQNIKQNEYLQKLISSNNVSPDDSEFWNEFLSFVFTNLDDICCNSEFMSNNIVPLMSQWMENNISSKNLASAIQVLVAKVALLKKNGPDKDVNYNLILWQTYNLSFILRNIFKYFIETLAEENVIHHCESKHPDGTGNDAVVMIENLISALIEILVDIELNEQSYNLHVEACKTFLVLLSVQMFFARPSMKSVIYSIVMKKRCSIHALLLTKTLLRNFIDQMPAPNPPNGSIIFGLASGVWNILTLGFHAKKSDEELTKEAVLARESLLLLLVLTNHCTKDINPYREALFQCTDSNTELTAGTVSDNSNGGVSSSSALTGFKIDFGRLYRTLCTTLNDDQTTLLLYMLLHQNAYFKLFVLSRTTDLDQFVIPVLKILYHSPERNSHHIYMSLIILLVLSEDKLFNSIIHDITVRNITWYTERNLTEISLGGLIILVIVRTIHFNMSKNLDRFLHTNLCATLANMSNHFKHLHNYVCQKLVNLFDKISKKYLKIQQQLKPVNGEGNSASPLPETITEEMKDHTLYEEVLRTILEIINATLTKNLLANPNLIYTLLRERKILESVATCAPFQDIYSNIDTVLTYFRTRIDQQSKDRSLSVEEIYEIIKQASLNWPKEKMKKFQELMFRYVEDEQPEDFFIPYIWSLVFRCSDIYWNSQNIILFNPGRNNNNNG